MTTRPSTAPRPPAGPAARPGDQAQGLRRMFAAPPPPVVALVANPHLGDSGGALDALAAALARLGCHALVVDAADDSPAPGELAALDLSACVEPLAGGVSYLAARGLARAHVDTRGSAAGWLELLALAAPQAQLLLLHAEADDLARVLQRSAVRPVLLVPDDPEGLKHAYAAAKLLAQRCGTVGFDLLLAGARDAARRARIAASLAACLDRFLGAQLHVHAGIEPEASTSLLALAAGQLDPAQRSAQAQPRGIAPGPDAAGASWLRAPAPRHGHESFPHRVA